MAKLGPEALVQIAANPSHFGYESYSLLDVDQYTEAELKQYLMNAVICLMINEGHLGLAVMAGKATQEAGFYLSTVGDMDSSEIFPKDKLPDPGKHDEAFAYAKRAADLNGIPLAILSLLGHQTTGEIMGMLATFPDVDPQEVLKEFSQTARTASKPSKPSRLN